MTWTYRVIKDEEGTHSIAEVYTDTPETGKVSWTVEPCYPIGEDLDELRRDIHMMLKAFDKPVLDEATLRETIKNETLP